MILRGDAASWLHLMVYVETVVRGFLRYHKYTIGTRLRESTWQVLTLIVKANNTPVAERRPLLVQLRDAVAEVDNRSLSGCHIIFDGSTSRLLLVL